MVWLCETPNGGLWEVPVVQRRPFISLPMRGKQ